MTNLLRLGGAIAVLYGARRFYRNWGTTKEESRMRLAGDDLLDGPVMQTTEAVWIDAPVATVWQWLVQVGQDRGGVYTFEALENLAGLQYHNADRIHPEWQDLAPGDTVRLVPKGWMGLRDGIALTVVDVVDHESIVLRSPSPERWEAVWSFHAFPHWDDRCRLMVRTRTRLRHPGQVLADELAGPAKAFVTRGMLLGIKRRAQQQFQAETSAAKASSDLHRVMS
ncbi:SRPBCC family protein [Mycobacterium sp. B14F4]|uniref:SRPBCC family protein n=1 Tax=Mycobacterium sp. B14F4 TaxID=3153565 RepID=UPI00325F1DA6